MNSSQPAYKGIHWSHCTLLHQLTCHLAVSDNPTWHALWCDASCCAVQMSERAACAQLAEQQEQLSQLEASVTKLKRQLQARSDDLATQRAVNQQLMLKKEEVEWQLLAAIAQVGAMHGHVHAGCEGAKACGVTSAGAPASVTQTSHGVAFGVRRQVPSLA